MSVKRYEPVEYSDHLGMRETEHGGYVDFEDYDSLRAQLEKVEAELKEARRRLEIYHPGFLEFEEKLRDAYQRGAREMREIFSKNADEVTAKHIRAVPLPTGPSESAKV